jgi:HD superfamily phosphohydrolase
MSAHTPPASVTSCSTRASSRCAPDVIQEAKIGKYQLPPRSVLTVADGNGSAAPENTSTIGHRLAEVVFQTLASDQSPAVKAAFEMAIAILNTKTPKYHLQRRPHASPMQWLHSLVDGEIDADRADYLLRDGRALGLDFAHYDVDRLVSNLILVHDPDLGFVTAVKETGLAALESYCLSRSRSNQVFVRHHKVAQTAIALRHASVAAFGHPASGDFLQVLQELGSTNLLKKANLLKQFGRFDDTWWVQVLRKLQEKNADPLTRACLDLVLDRARTLQSVWKRRGDLTDEQARKINSRVDGLFASAGHAIALADKRKHLLSQGILIMPFKFKPYARCEPDGRSVMLVKSKTRTEPASKVSPLIRNLHDLWEQEIHLYAFTQSGRSVSAEDVISSLWELQA